MPFYDSSYSVHSLRSGFQVSKKKIKRLSHGNVLGFFRGKFPRNDTSSYSWVMCIWMINTLHHDFPNQNFSLGLLQSERKQETGYLRHYFNHHVCLSNVHPSDIRPKKMVKGKIFVTYTSVIKKSKTLQVILWQIIYS